MGHGFVHNSAYAKTEQKAAKILNSKRFKHKWKKDFRIVYGTEDYDLENSEKVKIEVKSTMNEYRYNGNYLTLNMPNQHKQIIFKMLLNSKGKIKKWDLIKKRLGRWASILDEISVKKVSRNLNSTKKIRKSESDLSFRGFSRGSFFCYEKKI